MRIPPKPALLSILGGALATFAVTTEATPANKASLERYYDRFLTKSLDRCTTCHLPSQNQSPKDLSEFPHNPFGDRLRSLGEKLESAAAKRDLAHRLQQIAHEDSDADGVSNETEILVGHNPGDATDKPTLEELANVKGITGEFEHSLSSYRWQPFSRVRRPSLPKVSNSTWIRNPIDAFIAVEREVRGLNPRPAAPKEILLRRVYLDVLGLSPTPDEQRAFRNNTSPDAYEKLVDRLLDDPRYGERWGRHWMDVWRYSDWAGWSGGNQIRDSKPHIWRWRDWIVESLNQDKSYGQMIVEMLAADELAPENSDTLRATGFLVRNFKLLSREQWMDDTIKHTSQAFLGLTMGCAKCHDHMYDPISQLEYYQLRAVFEPHQVRTDRVPGEIDTSKNGLVRVYDGGSNAPTYLFLRGDERTPDTNRLIAAGVPAALCADITDPRAPGILKAEPVKLPRLTAFPDKREFVVKDLIADSQKAVATARESLDQAKANPTNATARLQERKTNLALAEARHAALLAVLDAEKLEDNGAKNSDAWKRAAMEAATAQRKLAVLEAKLKLQLAQSAQTEAQTKADTAAKALEALLASSEGGRSSESSVASPDSKTPDAAAKTADEKKKKDAADKAAKDLTAAKKKTDDAEKELAKAEKEAAAEPTTAYRPRSTETYPATSSGRRLAFARWVANRQNPLTARVAMNHIWLRHFGRGIVPTPADFGRNGRPASHPQLLDWLAAEFMDRDWSMKAMHRLILTSATYRMASTPDEHAAAIDPDNIYFWRMPSRRMEAEIVRDNLLFVSGSLDLKMSGPEIDQNLGLTSRRRSVYLRLAAEKEVEFLKLFDGPNVTECYQRTSSVMPQQALALANSELAVNQARAATRLLEAEVGADDEAFIRAVFQRILARTPTSDELRLCREFLGIGARGMNQTASVVPVAFESHAEKRKPESARAREHLVLVLFNHNDFITIR